MINTTRSKPIVSFNNITLDKTDKQILHILQTNATISNLELAEHINLSPTPCARRVKRLYDVGLIKGSMYLLDQEKLGLSLSVFIAISMDKHTHERFEKFEAAVKSFPEVISCSVVTGRAEDYLIRAVVRDMAHYEEFLLKRLNRIEGVSQVHTSFELRRVIDRAPLPIF